MEEKSLRRQNLLDDSSSSDESYETDCESDSTTDSKICAKEDQHTDSEEMEKKRDEQKKKREEEKKKQEEEKKKIEEEKKKKQEEEKNKMDEDKKKLVATKNKDRKKKPKKSKTKNPKYALVAWIETGQYGIVSVSDIEDKKMLYNPNIIEDIPHVGKGPAPASGWKKYPAAVLKIGPIKQELDDVGEELLEKYLQEKKGSEENLTSPHSKQESSNNDQQEMEKATKKSDKKKERKRKIEEENQRLQLKVADLQNELQNKKARLSPAAHQEPRSSLQQDLPKMVAAAVAETLKNLSSNTGAEPSTSRIPMASAADNNAIQKEKDIKELKEKLYAHATKEKIDVACSQPNRNKVIGDVLLAIYSEDELINSTITGKKTTRPFILDPLRLLDLKNYILKRFDGEATPANFNLRVRNKIRDFRKGKD